MPTASGTKAIPMVNGSTSGYTRGRREIRRECRSSRQTSSTPQAGTSTSPLGANGGRRSLRPPSTPSNRVLPPVRDSSIGATSSNPRLRTENLATGTIPSPRASRCPVDFNSPRSKMALQSLQKTFLPVILKHILRRRRLQCYNGVYPPRVYTGASVVDAITSSKCCLAGWPTEMLEVLVSTADFQYLRSNEIAVYHHETHLSSGLVVLLHGELVERRRDGKPSGSSDRPIHSKRVRTHYAPAVVCDMSVLCEDRSSTSIAVAKGKTADIAIISSRWFWQVLSTCALDAPKAKELLQYFKDVVLPHRREVMLTTYFASTVVLHRSWIWPAFTRSECVKLACVMEPRVLGIGELLYEEGTHCPYIYFVRRGSLTVLVKSEPLAVVEAGAAFGEISVLFNSPRNSSVIANSVCELYGLHREELLHRCKRSEEAAQFIVHKALDRRRRWLEEGKTRHTFGLVALLGCVPCLSHTTDAMREEMAQVATVLTVPHGYPFLNAGTPCDSLYVIGRGMVRFVSKGEAGNPNGVSSSFPSVMKSAGDYFGELCLLPHLWPIGAVSETTSDLWVLPRGVILSVLKRNLAEAQALEVCHHGMTLYRSQYGEISTAEGVMDSSTAPGVSAVHSETHTPKSKPQEPSLPTTSVVGGTDLTNFNWVRYVFSLPTRLDGPDSSAGGRRGAQRERHPVDRDVEKQMRLRVRELISLPTDNEPSSADCDFPGDISELQAIIVEQLLLTPTEGQPRLLKQVNNSHVTLVKDEGEAGSKDNTIGLHSDSWPIADGLACEEKRISIDELSELEVSRLQFSPKVPNGGIEADCYRHNFDNDGNLVAPMELSGFLALTLTNGGIEANLANHTKHRLSLADFAEGSCSNLGGRGFLNRGYFVRPVSGTSLSPSFGRPNSRRPTSRRPTITDIMSSRGGSQGSVMGDLQGTFSEQPRGGRTRPSSVDLTQQAKVSTEKSVSVLDRYVRIHDQDYFNAIVRVTPAPQDELFMTSDEDHESGSGRSTLILLLMHVRNCAFHAASKTLKKCTEPIVKAVVGERVLVRTPVMNDRMKPRWAIEESSFISFVKRGLDVVFIVCDASDENRIAYQCALPTDEINENGGVGQRTMCLRPFDVQENTAEFLEEDNASITVTMMAITASKYAAVQRHLQLEGDAPVGDVVSPKDLSTVYIQVLSLHNMSHRIEASVVVKLASDGRSTPVLRLPTITQRTRTPSWPAEVSFTKIQSDGLLTFEVYHKDSLIGAPVISVDDLAFGGVGIRQLPIILPQTSSDVIGEVFVHVLGAATSTMDEDTKPQRVIFVHVESFSIANEEAYGITPDPFVVLSNAGGSVVLRTPLAEGTFCASWNAEDASCFVPYPELAGSSEIYTLEVFDNNDTTPIGRVTLSISDSSLDVARVFDVPLEQPSRGVIRLRMHPYPVMELPRSKSLSKAHNATRFTKDDPLLLVHISGCRDLAGAEFGMFQIDPLVTFGFNRETYLTTSIMEGTTDPVWALPSASVLLRVRPEALEDAEFHVWDGIIDEVDEVGRTSVTMVSLCRTATHAFPLRPRAQALYHGTHRTLGVLHINTYCGKVDGPVLPTGVSPFFSEEMEKRMLDGGTSPHSHHLLLWRPERQAISTRAPQVRLSVTNVCNILPDAKSKNIRIAVTGTSVDNPTDVFPVLLVERRRVQASATWETGEASSVLDLRRLRHNTIQIEVVATNVREKLEKDDAAAQSKYRVSEYVAVGTGELAFSHLADVPVGEIRVATVYLSDAQTSSAANTIPFRSQGASGRPPMAAKRDEKMNKGAPVDRPSVSLCFLGMDSFM